jgi:hypothetical protein
VNIFVNEAARHRPKNAKGEKFCERALPTLPSPMVATMICLT